MPQPLGAAPARTTLAAQRTGLTLLVGSALLARLTLGELGPAVLAVPALVLALLLVAAVADRRLPGAPPAIGVRTAALTAGVALLGITELMAVVR